MNSILKCYHDLAILLTAFIPHTTVVLPHLTIAEPSAVPIEPAFKVILRNSNRLRPSGRDLRSRKVL